MKRNHVARLILSGLLAGATALPVLGAVEKGPYMLYSGVNSEMTVMWQLSNSPDCLIKWGTDTTYSDGSATISAGSDNLYRADIFGLQPGTKYYYSVNNGVGTGEFWAAPADDEQNIKFLGWGDSRSNPNITAAVMDDVLALDDSYHTFALMAGDWTQKDREEDWSSQHFNKNYSENLEVHTKIPLNGCRGNHEKEALVFNKYYPYDFARAGATYYAFEYGPVKVITIDQYKNFSPGSAQYNWVESELANTAKAIKIIQAHEPAWTSGKHGNNTDFQDLQPLFEQYGVAMVFCGHNHVYTRCENRGIHHITSGGAGAGADPGDDDGSLSDPKVKFTKTVEHFIKFEVTGGRRLDATVIDERGREVDTFSYGVIDDQPPVMSDVSKDVVVGNALNVALADSVVEMDGDPLTFEISGLPVWASMDANGVVTGTPGSNDVGTVVANVKVSDKDGFDEATLSLTVKLDGTGPSVDAGPDFSVTTPVGVPATITLSATGTGDIVDYVWKKDGLRVGDGQTITVDAPAGTNTYVVRVKDTADLRARDSVIVIVSEVGGGENEAPYFGNNTILSTRARAGKAFEKDISGKAKDPDNDKLTWSISGPNWLSISADGLLTGTPANSDKGRNEFTVTVNDGKGGSASALVKIRVR